MDLPPVERDAIYGGADAQSVLADRVERSQAELETALAELREVMSDQDTLDTFGVDLSHLR